MAWGAGNGPVWKGLPGLAVIVDCRKDHCIFSHGGQTHTGGWSEEVLLRSVPHGALDIPVDLEARAAIWSVMGRSSCSISF